MTPIVFAGPSLHGLDLTSLHGVDLAPPAGCGDILRAVRSGREIIGLIDGSFECGPGTFCDLNRLRCETLRQSGEACRDGLECETGYCSSTCMAPPRAYPEFCLGHIPPPPH